MHCLRIGWLISSSLLAVLSCMFQAAAADLTITMRDMLHDPKGDHTSQTVYYVTTDRKRIEHSAGTAVTLKNLPKSAQGQWILIENCKSGKEYDVDAAARQYTEILPGKLTLEELREKVDAEEARTGADQQRIASTVEVETKDTGERQSFFGFTGRHVVTTRRRLIPALGKHWDEEVSDGWYVDLPVATECNILRFTPASVQQVLELRKRGIERYEMAGTPETGFPVKLKKTEHIYSRVLDDYGRDLIITTREIEVVEISDRPLDRSLFEVPSGFKRRLRTIRNPAIPPEMLRTSSERPE